MKIEKGKTYPYGYAVDRPDVGGHFEILDSVLNESREKIFIGRFVSQHNGVSDQYYLFDEHGKLKGHRLSNPKSVRWFLILKPTHDYRIIYNDGSISGNWNTLERHSLAGHTSVKFMVRENGDTSTVKLMDPEEFSALIKRMFP